MKHRAKGNRAEQDIVKRHKALGIHAARVPGSGGFQNSPDHDVDLYLLGEEAGAFISEVKADQGAVPKTLIKQLGENDLLFIKPDRVGPYVFLPWATWERLLKG